jgi:hypothetical protein
MGRRERRALRAWAEALVDRHADPVADLLGVDPPLPDVVVDVVPRSSAAAWTSGLTIMLNETWFREHPDDEGAVIHELAHALMRAPVYDGSTAWLIEGLADHVRNALGMEMPWTRPHFEQGKATAGYQTTAHFLAWLDGVHPGAVRRLSRALIDDEYGDTTFVAVTGRSLADLTAAYERAAGT